MILLEQLRILERLGMPEKDLGKKNVYCVSVRAPVTEKEAESVSLMGPMEALPVVFSETALARLSSSKLGEKALYRKGVALFKRRQLDDLLNAERCWKELLTLEPKNGAARRMLSETKFAQKKAAEAEKVEVSRMFSKEIVVDEKSNKGFEKLLRREERKRAGFLWKAFGRPVKKMWESMRIKGLEEEDLVESNCESSTCSEDDKEDSYAAMAKNGKTTRATQEILHKARIKGADIKKQEEREVLRKKLGMASWRFCEKSPTFFEWVGIRGNCWLQETLLMCKKRAQ